MKKTCPFGAEKSSTFGWNLTAKTCFVKRSASALQRCACEEFLHPASKAQYLYLTLNPNLPTVRLKKTLRDARMESGQNNERLLKRRNL